MKHDYRTLHSKLAVFHQWPGTYLFKFIVPQEKLTDLEQVFAGHEFTTRTSRNGRYVSLTCERHFESSDAVIDVYREVEKIEGAFAL